MFSNFARIVVLVVWIIGSEASLIASGRGPRSWRVSPFVVDVNSSASFGRSSDVLLDATSPLLFDAHVAVDPEGLVIYGTNPDSPLLYGIDLKTGTVGAACNTTYTFVSVANLNGVVVGITGSNPPILVEIVPSSCTITVHATAFSGTAVADVIATDAADGAIYFLLSGNFIAKWVRSSGAFSSSAAAANIAALAASSGALVTVLSNCTISLPAGLSVTLNPCDTTGTFSAVFDGSLLYVAVSVYPTMQISVFGTSGLLASLEVPRIAPRRLLASAVAASLAVSGITNWGPSPLHSGGATMQFSSSSWFVRTRAARIMLRRGHSSYSTPMDFGSSGNLSVALPRTLYHRDALPGTPAFEVYASLVGGARPTMTLVNSSVCYPSSPPAADTILTLSFGTASVVQPFVSVLTHPTEETSIGLDGTTFAATTSTTGSFNQTIPQSGDLVVFDQSRGGFWWLSVSTLYFSDMLNYTVTTGATLSTTDTFVDLVLSSSQEVLMLTSGGVIFTFNPAASAANAGVSTGALNASSVAVNGTLWIIVSHNSSQLVLYDSSTAASSTVPLTVKNVRHVVYTNGKVYYFAQPDNAYHWIGSYLDISSTVAQASQSFGSSLRRMQGFGISGRPVVSAQSGMIVFSVQYYQGSANCTYIDPANPPDKCSGGSFLTGPCANSTTCETYMVSFHPVMEHHVSYAIPELSLCSAAYTFVGPLSLAHLNFTNVEYCGAGTNTAQEITFQHNSYVISTVGMNVVVVAPESEMCTVGVPAESVYAIAHNLATASNGQPRANDSSLTLASYPQALVLTNAGVSLSLPGAVVDAPTAWKVLVDPIGASSFNFSFQTTPYTGRLRQGTCTPTDTATYTPPPTATVTVSPCPDMYYSSPACDLKCLPGSTPERCITPLPHNCRVSRCLYHLEESSGTICWCWNRDTHGDVYADCRPQYFEPWINETYPGTLAEWVAVREVRSHPGFINCLFLLSVLCLLGCLTMQEISL